MKSILFLIEIIYSNIVRCNNLRNKKFFPIFFLHFENLHPILNIFKKDMTLIANIFLNLGTPKNVIRQMSQKPRFRGPFDKWHDKRAETLLKSERQHIYHIYWLLWRQFSWKKSLLVIYKILGLFLNTLTADQRHSVPDRDNL